MRLVPHLLLSIGASLQFPGRYWYRLHLDSVVTIDGRAEEDVKNRISKATSAFSQLNNTVYGGQDIYP
jgi:hypothetical protein